MDLLTTLILLGKKKRILVLEKEDGMRIGDEVHKSSRRKRKGGRSRMSGFLKS